MASTFEDLATELTRTANVLMALTTQTTQDAAARTLNHLRSRSSGRPGPRRITGAYHASMHVRVIGAGGDSHAIVGSNAPQARRLEYGFVGTDSLGRRYNQPPFPHWRPTAEWVDATYPKMQDRAVKVAIG